MQESLLESLSLLISTVWLSLFDWKSSYVLAEKGGFEKIYHFIGLSAMTSNVSGGVKCNYKKNYGNINKQEIR